jgi:hypothetical protein
VFVLTHYDSEGNKTEECKKMIWDLREDAKVQITGGQYKGLKGEIVGKRKEGVEGIRGIMNALDIIVFFCFFFMLFFFLFFFFFLTSFRGIVLSQ